MKDPAPLQLRHFRAAKQPYYRAIDALGRKNTADINCLVPVVPLQLAYCGFVPLKEWLAAKGLS